MAIVGIIIAAGPERVTSSAGALATIRKTWPATHAEIAGSATLKSVRWSRRLRWLSEVMRPSKATVRVAGAGPNSRIDANTNTSETDTVAERPGTLIRNRLLAK